MFANVILNTVMLTPSQELVQVVMEQEKEILSVFPENDRRLNTLNMGLVATLPTVVKPSLRVKITPSPQLKKNDAITKGALKEATCVLH